VPTRHCLEHPVPDNDQPPPIPTGEPIRITDEQLLPFLIADEHRRQSAHMGITDEQLLPYPHCPTCGERVEAARAVAVAYERFARTRAADLPPWMAFSPCGHHFITTDEALIRLQNQAVRIVEAQDGDYIAKTLVAPPCPAALLSLDEHQPIRRCVFKGPHIDHQAADGTRWTRPEDLDDTTDAPFLNGRPAKHRPETE
jgi:hypothetical protein